MTTQANHKRNMRDAEIEVLNAEKWASLAWLNGMSYPGPELVETGKRFSSTSFMILLRARELQYFTGRSEGLRRCALVDKRD